MPTAYVLLNTEIGAENQVLKALKKIEGVAEAHSLWGVYDIIANVEAESMDKLKSIITKRIAKISQINSKLTMIISEEPKTLFHEHMVFEPTAIIQR
ncbi:MAG: Lrp/AsnC family transcriptional regulator [Candidatus Bathyarchaeota archaeon]|nr:Lrp/AsnC family transcriptional regulator [Candidatus Bathyarchaeota archaeon]